MWRIEYAALVFAIPQPAWPDVRLVSQLSRQCDAVSHSEVPTEEIAGAMEAVEVTMVVDDDNNVTVAEPDEEELPEAIAEPEQEQSAEVDFDEGYDDDEEQERHPVLVIENIRHIERIAASAQVALQTPYFPSHRSAICVDPHQLAYTYMSFLRVVPMHSHALEGLQQICESTTASSGNMLTMAIVTIKLDPWAVLHVWNPVTRISAEVSDTEILNEPRNGQAAKDPDGTEYRRTSDCRSCCRPAFVERNA